MGKSVSPNAAAIAQEPAESFKGKLDQPKIDAVVAALKTPTTAYSAHCEFTIFAFWLRFYVNTNADRWQFVGDGGRSIPSASARRAGTCTRTT